jgi:hypothetical protein
MLRTESRPSAKKLPPSERSKAAELVRIIGSVMLAAVNDNDDAAFSASVIRRLRARVTRPAQRERVETWLASLPQSVQGFAE